MSEVAPFACRTGQKFCESNLFNYEILGEAQIQDTKQQIFNFYFSTELRDTLHNGLLSLHCPGQKVSAGSFLCGTFQNTNATFTSRASQFVFSTPYIISMSLFRTNHCQISTVLTSIAHKLNGFFISRVRSLYSKLNEK